jgi:hypothetical protein
LYLLSLRVVPIDNNIFRDIRSDRKMQKEKKRRHQELKSGLKSKRWGMWAKTVTGRYELCYIIFN